MKQNVYFVVAVGALFIKLMKGEDDAGDASLISGLFAKGSFWGIAGCEHAFVHEENTNRYKLAYYTWYWFNEPPIKTLPTAATGSRDVPRQFCLGGGGRHSDKSDQPMFGQLFYITNFNST